MVEIFKALGDENRLRLINLLFEKELCVCEFEAILQMTQSNVSRHLSKLKSIALITSKKEAQWVYYSLDESFIKENKDLLTYLKHSLDVLDPYKEDLKKLKLYMSSGMSCQSLKEDKDFIVNINNKEIRK